MVGRRVTRAGAFVLAGLVGSAALGLDTNRTMAYQAFTFLLAVLVIAIISSRFVRPCLDVERRLPPYASAGEPFVYRAIVRSRAKTSLSGLTLFEDLIDPRPAIGEFLHADVPPAPDRPVLERGLGYARWRWLIARRQHAAIAGCPVPPIPSSGEVEVRVEAVPLRRGRLAWTGTTIGCPDPFGLVRALRAVRGSQSVVVLPRRYSLPPIALPGARKYQPGGVALAGSVGDAEEFVSLRDYRPGDPRRRIHWRSWARVGKPIVKEYEEEFFVRYGLVLDTFTAFETPAFEEAVSVAASFACSLDTQESLLDLMFVGTDAFCFTSGRGLGTTERMLEILAAVQVCHDRSFRDLHRLVIERTAELSGCIAVLLSWDADRAHFIEALAASDVPVMVLVVTAAGARLAAMPPRAPSIRFHHLEVGAVADGLRAL